MSSILNSMWQFFEYTGWLIFAVVVTSAVLRHLLAVTKPFVDLTKKDK